MRAYSTRKCGCCFVKKDDMTEKNTEMDTPSILRLIEKVERIRKSSVYDAGYVTIMASEMDTIKAIGDNEPIYVTELSKKLGVTKGAVSQQLTKLEKKGLIIKKVDEENAAKRAISLTSLGRRMYERHDQFHKELNLFVESLLQSASEESRQFLEMFIEKISGKLWQEFDIFNEYLGDKKTENDNINDTGSQ